MRIKLLLALMVLLFILPTFSLATNKLLGPTTDLSLTDQEKSWLAQHPVINVRISLNYPPFEFFDEGRYQGIAYDYLVMIGQRTGLTFQPVSDMSWSDSLVSIEEKTGVDLIIVMTHTQERESFLNFTRDYLSFPEVIFTRKDGQFVSVIEDLAGLVVATEDGFVESAFLTRDIPDVTLIETETTEEALKAVALGEADAYVGNLAVGSYLIDKHGLVDLKVASSAPYGDDAYAMGVRKDWPILVQLLEKGLDSLTAADHHSIKNKWLAIRYEHGLNIADIVKWVVVVALIAMVFIIQLRQMVKHRTRELQKFHDDLEDLVDTRTSELKSAQEELVKSERMALLGHLTSTVSHELRNPLGTINNTLFAVRGAISKGEIDKTTSPLEIMERNIERCNRIVSELLDFCRKPSQERVPVRIDQWLNPVLQEFDWPTDIQWHSNCDCQDNALIDPESLRRAIINILDNAIHAVQIENSSAAEIYIRCQTSGSNVEIEVQDTGIGMSEEVLGKIFEPLYSTKSFGVGLGVPIIKDIINDLGGEIRYTSKLGEGTTVSIWLPVDTAPGAE